MSSENTQDSQSRHKMAICWSQVYPMVSAYVHSMIFNFHDSEDVIQEVGVAMADDFDQFDQSKELLPWVMAITRHKVVDYIRCKGRRRQTFDDYTMQLISEAFESIAGESDDVKNALEDCMRQLKKRPRHVLELRYLRELDVLDISKRMGLSSNAIYVMLHRIRTVLAECIQSKINIRWETS